MTDPDPSTDAETDADTVARPRPIGINHVALEVGDVEAAVEFYQTLFAVELRGRTATGAFLDMGDQFIALTETTDATASVDDHRHFGLVVDDVGAVERRLDAMDIDRLDTGGLDVRDPWGNRIQIVGYDRVQFTKADHVRAGMGPDVAALEKTDDAIAELAAKGMAPPDRTPDADAD